LTYINFTLNSLFEFRFNLILDSFYLVLAIKHKK